VGRGELCERFSRVCESLCSVVGEIEVTGGARACVANPRALTFQYIKKNMMRRSGRLVSGTIDEVTCVTELLRLILELTRFSGHLMVSFGGVRDGDQKCQVYAGV
jgi:hypothetical protein